MREIKKIKIMTARKEIKSSTRRPRKFGTLSKLGANYNLESNNFAAAKTAIDQGISLVKERQKLILLADS